MEKYYEYIIYIVIVCIFIIAVKLSFFRKEKLKKLSTTEKKDYKNKFYAIKSSQSAKEKIIDYDTLYHKILLSLGYHGSFGDILKMNPKEIADINMIWELHKLRNKLVHDFDVITTGALNKKVKAYEKELKIYF